jgi:3-hydroxyisobutyrate dehydrogenase
MPDKLRVGYVGLGVMGKPMARNLLRAGFPLTVHNRSRGAVDELAAEGATPADSPAEVARASDVVLSCLPGPADVRLVYLGESGVLEGVGRGAVLIEMSTIDPGTHREIAGLAAARGAGYLDAPVSGGSTGAQNATLTIMVGGEAATLERVRPVLDAVGKQVYHLGPVGAGATAKLVNNMLGAINLAGAIEALVLGQKAGLDPRQLAEVISNSSGASRSFTSAVPEILRRNFEPGFTIDLQHKDVSLATDLGRLLGVRLLAGSLAAQVLQEARGAGYGKKSIFAAVLPLEQNAGIEVKE